MKQCFKDISINMIKYGNKILGVNSWIVIPPYLC